MPIVNVFEIPVSDLDRSIAFYSRIFMVHLERTIIDGYEMALFPETPDGRGPAGALAKGESYVPSVDGTRIYFLVDGIDEVLDRVHAAGGKTLYPKTSIGDFGYVAEFEDSEGNRIALSSR